MQLEKPNTLPIEELRAEIRRKKDKKKNEPEIICWQCDTHIAKDVHHLDGHHRNNTPSNLVAWCKRCHNETHGISDNLTDLTLAVRQVYSIQQERMAMGSRLFAYGNLGYTAPFSHEMFEGLQELEKRAKKIVAKMIKTEPIYNAYLERVAGIGPSIAGALIAEIGDPGRFDTISSLWAYAGLDVRDGEARKRRKGQKANWNARLRSVSAKLLTDQFIKLRGCFGRSLYDQYKEYYRQRDGDTLSDGHIDNRARRKVAKVFLSCLWVAWRRIKGLPVTEPYALTLPGHTHLVTPEQWAGKDWDSAFQPKLLE